MQQRSLSAAWKKGTWIKRLSGLMLAHSPAQRFADEWIASLPVSHARQSQSPGSNSEPPIRDGSGPKLSAPIARLVPDGCSWKTSEDCFLPWAEACSEPSLPTWPVSGCLRSGQVFRRPTAELRNEESEYSCWPTPNIPNREPERAEDKRPESGGEDLQTTVMRWPTPGAAISNDGEAPETWLARREVLKAKGINGNGAGTPLAMACVLWQTPQLPNGGDKTRGGGRGDELLLEGQAALWMTPHGMAGTDHTGKARAGGEFAEQATKAVARWATATATDHKGSSKEGQRRGQLSEQTECLSGLPVHQTETAGQPSSETHPGSLPRSAKRRLNPLFVEWLQGLPTGWSSASASIDFERLETWLSRFRRRLRSLCYGNDCMDEDRHDATPPEDLQPLPTAPTGGRDNLLRGVPSNPVRAVQV